MTRRWLWRGLLVLLLYALIPEGPDRKIGRDDVGPIWLVNHGYHVGLVLSREDLAGLPFLPHFPSAYRWFEIGWGDDGFYRQAPSRGDVSVSLAAKALLWPTKSVLHVVGLKTTPPTAFAGAKMIRLELDATGRARLRAHIARTVALPLKPLGPGLYESVR
ncbi:MAG: DUF2459 domain-containing protein [Neomegalonema sp.]|nr:DUF2459 domain-containing protein [Neomegalonema sp.]